MARNMSPNYGNKSPERGEEGNEFFIWYRDAIMEDPVAKRHLVDTDPERALRVFSVFSDREIGEMFVEKYTDDDGFGHAAYFVSSELGDDPGPGRPAGTYPDDSDLSGGVRFQILPDSGVPVSDEDDDDEEPLGGIWTELLYGRG